jgi:D-cysteine desulfhydrase family pyridoxal phosphate-dependent enzyme
LTRAALQARIDALPRVPLAHLPTPLDPCPRFSAALGGPRIYIKRDDMTGLAFGGNKTRQLEFLFAEIASQGADTVIAGAYSQSNWCRQITAAACKRGLKVALVLLHGEKGPRVQGNLLLDHLMGAEVEVVELEAMQQLQPELEAKAAAVEAAGGRPYIVAPFALEVLARSTVGYVNAAAELDAQLEQAGAAAQHVYVAGANMTPAGLALGLRALGRPTRVVGITPIEWEEDRATDIARIANATAKLLDIDLTYEPADIINDAGYIGERYGVVTPGCLEAIRLLARTEGIILDPVYSGKAMAGLIDHIRQGRIARNETVVFVHTGGLPALFAYAEDVMEGTAAAAAQ